MEIKNDTARYLQGTNDHRELSSCTTTWAVDSCPHHEYSHLARYPFAEWAVYPYFWRQVRSHNSGSYTPWTGFAVPTIPLLEFHQQAGESHHEWVYSFPIKDGNSALLVWDTFVGISFFYILTVSRSTPFPIPLYLRKVTVMRYQLSNFCGTAIHFKELSFLLTCPCWLDSRIAHCTIAHNSISHYY